ncbi:MAG: DUF1450 domain-containing protein [Erysipelotrichaceae bacterium]
MKISICEACSGITRSDILEAHPEAEVECGCLGYCGGFDGKKFALVNGELVSEETTQSLLAKMK